MNGAPSTCCFCGFTRETGMLIIVSPWHPEREIVVCPQCRCDLFTNELSYWRRMRQWVFTQLAADA